MFRQEECYTQILFKLFSCNQNTLFKFIGGIPKYNTNLYIQPEYEIKDVGRLDVYASYCNVNGEVTNVIIENKIDSGINYITSKGESIDQLTRYYEYFEEEKKKNNAENIYIILCPNEKEALLTAEIKSLKTCDDVKEVYNIITYNKVYEFFNGKEEDFQDKGFEYMHCWGDIIELFRRLSLTRKEICEETLRNNIAKHNPSTTTTQTP